jgi:PTS system mannose-specific IIA component
MAKNNQPATGIILVTHADYGQALIRAAELILGPVTGCRSIGVDASQEVDKTLATLKEAIGSLDSGNGVLALTDMFGGTPTNLSLSLLSAYRLEVITGVSLPMLLKVLGSRHLPPEELAKVAKNAGNQGIVVAGEVLRKKLSDG